MLTYWGRVNKTHAIKMAREFLGDEYADERNRKRKADSAAAMERVFAEYAVEPEGLDAEVASKTTRWLPDGMAFVTEATGDGGGDQSDTFEAPEITDGFDIADG